jgi:hypothetical protein
MRMREWRFRIAPIRFYPCFFFFILVRLRQSDTSSCLRLLLATRIVSLQQSELRLP